MPSTGHTHAVNANKTAPASTTLNRNTHAGNTICLSSLTGLTVTLPASTGKGDMYEVFVLVTNTSSNYVIQVANSTDIMAGAVHLTTDIAGTSMPTSTTSDTITMNGTTTGGLRGTWLRFKDASLGFWALEGGIVCSGVEATPFSAAV
jgi:hypothetical protein